MASTETLVVEDPPRPARRQVHPAALAVTSAFVLWLAFPPADRGYLGWIALVPFFSLVRSDRWSPGLYFSAWIGGLAFGLLSMSWVAGADAFGMIWMALFMSLWWPLFLLPARIGTRFGWPPMLIAPVVWVGLEYARAHLLSGFPWYYLAHTQYAYLPVIQMCDLAGAWGLSLLMAASNAWLTELIRHLNSRRQGNGPPATRGELGQAGIILALVAMMLIYGGARLLTARFRPGPRIALLQTDFPQALKNGTTMETMISTLNRLVLKAIAETPRPDLIVWPETSYPLGVVQIDPNLTEAEFASQARRIDPESTPSDWRDRQASGTAGMRALTDGAGVPMLVGTPTYDFKKSGLDRYNSAVLFTPGQAETTSYHKQSLVPFGEYIPFVEAMPWLLRLTPYTDGYVPSLSPGSGPQVIESKGIRYAPIICFEDTIPHVVRAIFDRPGPSPDVLVNLTNDGWFRGTAEHQAHLAISVFRTVENRRPMVRAVNTGISSMIDGNGRIHDTLARETSGVLIVSPPLDSRVGFYTRTGDWLPLFCLIATFALLCLGILLRRHTSALAHPHSMG